MSSVSFADLERMVAAESPDLVRAIVTFAGQPEPYDPEAPPDRMDLSRLRTVLTQARGARRKAQRRERSREAWSRYLAQDKVAPQMQLADLVVRLYETRTGPARGALLTLIREAPLTFGLWGGFKRVYKRSQAELDAEVFAALAVRIDRQAGRSERADVGPGTIKYLSRRSWRFLRELGKASPELYVSFAVEVLRTVDDDSSYSPTTSKIMRSWARKWGSSRDVATGSFEATYLEAWKRSPDPLLVLLETCRSEGAAEFAINGLKELFPETVRSIGPDLLARLCRRPHMEIHEFVVEMLEGPAYHSARLEDLGLHDAVLALLRSYSPRARQYAIGYARTHADRLTTDFLVTLVDDDKYAREVVQFAASLLTAKSARQLGLPTVLRLLGYDASRKWAEAALRSEFEVREFDQGLLADLLLREATHESVRELIEERLSDALPVSFWIGLLRRMDDEEDVPWDAPDHALDQISRFPLASLPADFLLEALGHDRWSDEVGGWLEDAEALPPELDAERIKGLVFDPATRAVAFALLGNTKLFGPDQVGVDFLLALARRADPSLHAWAHRYLLENVGPDRLGPDPVARMFAHATGAREPDPMRSLAQTWLLCHHPRVGPHEERSKALGITPGLPREAYTIDLVWPTLWDDRPDVRRFGVTIARAELARWNQPTRVFELADAPAREVRNVAYDALSQAGERNADADLALTVDQLDPALVFSLTESTLGSTRELAMTLIRKHYARLGGAERLGWLMQSADREVRMYAVRLLWEKHRPTPIPPDWKPAGSSTPRGSPEPFLDGEALRDLLRRLLFAVPPARGGEKGGDRRGKRLPASVAKRRIVEVVRDFGVEDKSFADLVAPVLGEFTGSLARGEWQICLSALMTLRRVHGIAVEGLV